MSKEKSSVDPKILVDVVISALQDVKAENIVSIDLRETEHSVCDFFVICTGTSNTHVNALSKSVEREVKTAMQEKPWHAEGSNNAQWVLLDYVNTVVHIFQEETREFYNIEELWGDGKFTHHEDDEK